MNQKNHDDFAGDDVNKCKLARVREERKAEMECIQKMQVYKEVLGQEVHGCDSDDADQCAETHCQQSRKGKIKNGENQAHHGKRRCTSVLQRTQHVASVCGALRRGQKTWEIEECAANFQCRCTARGPQQEIGRNATLTSCTTVDSE